MKNINNERKIIVKVLSQKKVHDDMNNIFLIPIQRCRVTPFAC